uniref:ARAD1C07986p n=1 Tax=Blastobotrys adeninivorans TaxID=409370 RepID=A0A060SZX6_BLAAD
MTSADPMQPSKRGIGSTSGPGCYLPATPLQALGSSSRRVFRPLLSRSDLSLDTPAFASCLLQPAMPRRFYRGLPHSWLRFFHRDRVRVYGNRAAGGVLISCACNLSSCMSPFSRDS